MSACLCGRWCFCLVSSLAETKDGCFCEHSTESIFLRCVSEEASGCDVVQRSRRTKRVLPSSPFHFLPGCGYCSPPPPSKELDPRADVLLRRSSMGADVCVSVAVLHHLTTSARKRRRWCSAKLRPPQLRCEWSSSPKLSPLCGCGAPHQPVGL